jgi:hypothetical protein
MAALSLCGRLGRQRVALTSTFLSARLRTTHERFRLTWLSGSSLAPVQHWHITCASPCKAVHLDCFALCVAFPRSLVGHHSHDYYQSSVAISLAEGRRSRVLSRWYVLATDVGHPLISLLDLIGHRPQRRGCDGREPSPFARHGTGFRRDAGGGHVAPIGDWVSNNPVLPVSCGSCGTSTSHVFRRPPL